MFHDLEGGLIHLSKGELRKLGEIRSPIDERVIPYLIKSTRYGIEQISMAAEAADKLASLGLADGPVPHSEVVDRMRREISFMEALLPELEAVSVDVEFKWRDASFDKRG